MYILYFVYERRGVEVVGSSTYSAGGRGEERRAQITGWNTK